MRSDTAFFSAAVISRRFLCGLTSGWLSAEAAVAVLGEERRDAERAAGAEAPRSCSTGSRIPWTGRSPVQQDVLHGATLISERTREAPLPWAPDDRSP